jgi:hypothetical protein
MNNLRIIAGLFAILCFLIGTLASMGDGGTMAAVVQFGHTLFISGAIIVAGLLISVAIYKSKSN